MKICNYFLLFSLLILGISCQDNRIIPEDLNKIQLKNAEYTNSYYDQAFEWDNVTSFEYRLSSEDYKDDLSVPWAPGNANALGIPSSWIDHNYENQDETKRLYSKYNGWELIYSNLAEKTQRNKYFGLYNKYTGILRLFFIAIESSSGIGTSSVFGGLQIQGPSSILNFGHAVALPMNIRPQYSTYTFSPECSFAASGGPVTGIGYKSNAWYGLEIECAYDDSNYQNIKSAIKLWAANVQVTKTVGSSTGTISGNISTVYSGFSSNFDLNLAFTNDNKVTIKDSYNSASENLGENIKNEVDKGNKFFKNIWDNIAKQVPDAAALGVKEGIKALFSSGASVVTGQLGKLVNSVLGVGSSTPQTSLSTVDLGTKSNLQLESEGVTTLAGWGAISSMPVPGTGGSTNLYNKKMGVWNISEAPKVLATMKTEALWWPDNLVPNQDKPQATQVGFEYSLYRPTLIWNQEVLKNFSLQNFRYELVYEHVWDLSSAKNAYGLLNGQELYSSSTYRFAIKQLTMDYRGATWNPNTFFQSEWDYVDRQIQENKIYCRVSFELTDNATGKTYAHSKYFRVTNWTKGSHQHIDRIID